MACTAVCRHDGIFSLILPALGLGYWLLRGIAGGAALASLWEPALGSLSAAGIAAVVTVIAALPVAILSHAAKHG